MNVDVFDLAKSVSITTVVGHYVPLRHKGGGRAYGLCPFHHDRHIGSFVVTERTGKYVCYACGERGDSVDFVSHICGIDAFEAALTVCEDAALISHSDAESMRSKSSRSFDYKGTPPVYHKPELLLSPKAEDSHLDKVYRCFIRAAGPLTPDMRTTLETERFLRPSELNDFFPFPQREELPSFWPRFRAELATVFEVEQEDIQDKLLLGVPGFFLNNSCDITLTAAKSPSFGIVLRNRYRKVSGLQMRSFETAKDKRYMYFSSAFADGGPKSYGSFGCGGGYIEDVLYPYRKWCGAIAITEGRFKAISLAKMGCLVVNMHSISNYDPVGEVARALAEQWPRSKNFLLVYDSEDNQAVTKSAKQLFNKLSPIKPTVFAVWDNRYGKGIDDVVNAGHFDQLRCVSAEEYFEKEDVGSGVK